MQVTATIAFDRQIRRLEVSMSSRKRRRNRALKPSRRRRWRRLLHCGGAKQTRRSASSKAMAERLAALRRLIPTKPDGAATAGYRLFEETAEHILLLRTQVEVLKMLVDVYSPLFRVSLPFCTSSMP